MGSELKRADVKLPEPQVASPSPDQSHCFNQHIKSCPSAAGLVWLGYSGMSKCSSSGTAGRNSTSCMQLHMESQKCHLVPKDVK